MISIAPQGITRKKVDGTSFGIHVVCACGQPQQVKSTYSSTSTHTHTHTHRVLLAVRSRTLEHLEVLLAPIFLSDLFVSLSSCLSLRVSLFVSLFVSYGGIDQSPPNKPLTI